VLSNVFDHMIFTSPAEEKGQWETTHNGKLVPIPRPVGALRIWSASAGRYEDIDPHMPGAPALADRDTYWQTFLGELRQSLNVKYGEEFIDDCIRLDKEEIKEKYGF
jgi:hypothetical protein